VPERLKSPRLRLFVAVELPENVRVPLVEWRARSLGAVPEARLPADASLHVTLVFLGYQYERDVQRITDLCFGEPAGGILLQPTGMVGIPPSRPRLYALGLDDEAGALGAWQLALSKRLHAAGLYEPEKRPFWAHVTLARGKRNRALPRVADPPALPGDLAGPFVPERATLYRSTPTPRGAVYDPLAGMELSPGTPPNDEDQR
jgi:RNA 2',3'-cyclic 3'-phosphodiesterase